MNNNINSSSSLDEGKLSYEWASARMIALERSISKLESEQPLQNLMIGVCLHITKETSVLVRGLQRLGANVSLCASNPLSTQDEIVSYLSSVGVDVHAKRGQTDDEYFESDDMYSTSGKGTDFSLYIVTEKGLESIDLDEIIEGINGLFYKASKSTPIVPFRYIKLYSP